MRLLFKTLTALTIALVAGSCSASAGIFADVQLASGVQSVYGKQTVPFRTLAVSGFPYIYDLSAQKSVFKSKEDFDAFWNSLEHKPISLPPIDYSAEQGILVAFGPQPTGMISGEIAAVEDAGDKLVVHSILWVPPPDSAVTADVGFPYHLITIPKTDKPVEFAQPVEAKWTARPSDKPRPTPSSPTPTPFQPSASQATEPGKADGTQSSGTQATESTAPDGPEDCGPEQIWVNPYERSDGTHVRGYCRKKT